MNVSVCFNITDILGQEICVVWYENKEVNQMYQLLKYKYNLL